VVALVEHQAKELLAAAGLPVPRGQLVRRGDDIDAACLNLRPAG
jgi:succinyl-CoA synthetase beta subunit